MKKIDLHIHTFCSDRDSKFKFSIDKLEDYVEQLKIDCIAITNHNLFNLEQFKSIREQLKIKVFPGIEINLEEGHLLLISEDDELEIFKNCCDKIEQIMAESNKYVSIESLKYSFNNLSKYLLIPHYDKDPILKKETINRLSEYITAGEVASPKKFIYKIKEGSSLVPVLFSDSRFKEDMGPFSLRQTYIDTDNTSLKAIKMCLSDKNKVFLTRDGGHDFLPILDNGQKISTGLNVILGERSSGKTYTLDRIKEAYGNVKYIKQFELLQNDSNQDEFNKLLSSKQGCLTEDYLREFKIVVEDVYKVDIIKNKREVEDYLHSLLKVASDEEKKDIFSRCSLFNETLYSVMDNNSLEKLIESTRSLLVNKEYKEIINKHINESSLTNLIIELIIKHNEIEELNLKKNFLNSIIANIKEALQSKTSSSSINEIDLYQIALDGRKVDSFAKVVSLLQKEKIIKTKDIRRFTIEATRKKFKGAKELKKIMSNKIAFSNAYKVYKNPYEYLGELKKIEGLALPDFYKYFVNIQYRILNEDGCEISGGERSEFNLLQKIQDANNYDILLLDEPESSFDNLFLKDEVNEQIKDIAKSTPVVVVTHNNTIGASINPNFVLFTKKMIVNGKPVFKLFSGAPTDYRLKTIGGDEEIDNYKILLDCLEAGDEAYKNRHQTYEIIKD